MIGSQDTEEGIAIIADLRDTRHSKYDLVTPDSGFRAMMAIVAGYGNFVHNPPIQRQATISY
jgi:hypothetical protein